MEDEENYHLFDGDVDNHVQILLMPINPSSFYFFFFSYIKTSRQEFSSCFVLFFSTNLFLRAITSGIEF